jgi:hypothetical protein
VDDEKENALPERYTGSEYRSERMNRSMRTISGITVLLAIALTGCSLFSPRAASQTEIGEELAELQAMIPMIEAGLAVATAQDVRLATASTTGRASIEAVNADGVWPDTDPTPRDVFLGTGFSTTPTVESGWVRYPYDGTYIGNFYGAEGNDAEFYVKPYGTTDASAATIFQVKLYIHPTFSTTVDYVLEEYLVDAALTSWALVDTGGSPAPLYYITNRTVYFDGTIEEHEVVSNSVSSPGTYYDTLFDATADDDPSATNTSYDYPSDPLTVSPTTIGSGQYSAKVVSTIRDQGITVVEYYTEVSDGAGGITKSAVSYVLRDYRKGRFEVDAETVRRYIEYADGTKAVRARTQSVTTFGGESTDEATITEVVDVAENASGLLTFDSTTTAVAGNAPLYSTVVELTETAVDSGAYSGTSSYTTVTGSAYEYTMTLEDTASGGTMTVGGSETSVYFPVSRRDAKEIVAELLNGGTFTGKLKNSELKGIYKALGSDDWTSVEAALTFVYAITGNEVQLQ